jgi:dolichyl-phosphate-mannose--protein O-mannosyl transferase
LLAGWGLNLLPFLGIGRVMFLYHYLTALMFAVLLLAWLVDRAKDPRRIAVMLGIGALAAFLFFAPLSYGMKLTERGYNARVWFASWR